MIEPTKGIKTTSNIQINLLMPSKSLRSISIMAIIGSNIAISLLSSQMSNMIESIIVSFKFVI